MVTEKDKKTISKAIKREGHTEKKKRRETEVKRSERKIILGLLILEFLSHCFPNLNVD